MIFPQLLSIICCCRVLLSGKLMHLKCCISRLRKEGIKVEKILQTLHNGFKILWLFSKTHCYLPQSRVVFLSLWEVGILKIKWFQPDSNKRKLRDLYWTCKTHRCSPRFIVEEDRQNESWESQEAQNKVLVSWLKKKNVYFDLRIIPGHPKFGRGIDH